MATTARREISELSGCDPQPNALAIGTRTPHLLGHLGPQPYALTTSPLGSVIERPNHWATTAQLTWFTMHGKSVILERIAYYRQK